MRIPVLVLNVSLITESLFFLVFISSPFSFYPLLLLFSFSSPLIVGGGIHRPMACASSTAAGPEERSVRVCPRHGVVPVRLWARALHSEQSGSVSINSEYKFCVLELFLQTRSYSYYSGARDLKTVLKNGGKLFLRSRRSVFELLLFFGRDEFPEDPLKDILDSFQVIAWPMTTFRDSSTGSLLKPALTQTVLTLSHVMAFFLFYQSARSCLNISTLFCV